MKKNILIILNLIIGLVISFRCNPTIIFKKTFVEYLLVLTFLALVVILFLKNGKLKIEPFELILLLYPLLFFSDFQVSKLFIYTVVGTIYYFVMQRDYKYSKYVFYPLLLFSIFTSIISWIAVFFPDFYISKILTLFNDSQSLISSFKYRNMNMGFTNHYSRNSFYITVGIIIVFCNIFSSRQVKKNKILKYCILIFLLLTEFIVAKRGLTLFLFISIFLFIQNTEKDVNEKIKKSLKYIVLIVLFVLIGYMFIPSVANLINRIVLSFDSEDISTGRFGLYKIAIIMFISSPILGKGWGSFLKQVSGTTFQAVHNDYLQVLAETGIIGFLIIIIPNFIYYLKTKKQLKSMYNNFQEFSSVVMWLISFSYVYQLFIILYSLTGYPHFSYEQLLLYYISITISSGVRKYLNVN